MIDVDDMVSKCRKSSRLLRWLRRAIALIFGLALMRLPNFNMPEAGRWAKFGSGRNLAKFWRLSAQTVVEVARPVFFLCLCLCPAKSLKTTQKNESEWTLSIWLSLSGFWGWNVPVCGIFETFLGVTCVLQRSTVAKQCKSSTNVSNNWRHAASNPQCCLPVPLLSGHGHLLVIPMRFFYCLHLYISTT